MLRETKPEEQLEEIPRHYRQRDPIAYFLSAAAMLILLALRGEVFSPQISFLIAFLLIAQILSTLLAAFFWPLIVLWVGRTSFLQMMAAAESPNKNPTIVRQYLEGWWQHEFALDTLYIVFKVAFCVGCYRLLGPVIGIL